MTIWQWGPIAFAIIALFGAACFAALAQIKRTTRELAVTR